MQPAKNRKKNIRKRIVKDIISNEVTDYSKDPFFIKKAEESQKFLEEHGFPEELLKILEERTKKK